MSRLLRLNIDVISKNLDINQKAYKEAIAFDFEGVLFASLVRTGYTLQEQLFCFTLIGGSPLETIKLIAKLKPKKIGFHSYFGSRIYIML